MLPAATRRKAASVGVATACTLLLCAAEGPPFDTAPRPDVASARLGDYLAAIESVLDARPAAALAAVQALDRRLLAARSYVRNRDDLDARWSWTDARIREFHGSDEQRALQAEIALVRAMFERLNPGYTLFVNEQVRSLEVQLERWNSNDSVGAAAARLEAATVLFLETSGWPSPLLAQSRDLLVEFLERYVPDPAPTLAAPGLSPHGRMRAVDFHVYRGDVEVAVPEAESVQTVWVERGWAVRLDAAVKSSGARFEGPLKVPDEPWHYDYVP